MSKLNIDQKTVLDLFSSKKSDFLIPDYQRPYAWEEDELAALWDDIVTFAIPHDNAEGFDKDAEYFLGPIVTFRNSEGKLEIIDGQQRLTTLMLLLRAYYSRFENMQDPKSIATRGDIEKCLWKTDEFGSPDKDQLKIDSEVASDGDKKEFLYILETGETTSQNKSRYAQAFNFFAERINKFIDAYPSFTPHLAMRILKNIILLPIEAESQKTALQIFSTLNDRGLPLADADIFKSQMYKYFSDKKEKNDFIDRWKKLETRCTDIFRKSRSNPMDELFTRYMYYQRAKQGIRDTTTEGLRDFFEKDSYSLLKNDKIMGDLEDLAKFWNRVDSQEGFSNRILRRLFVLGYAPNRMWTFLVSVYFLHNRDEKGQLAEIPFYDFLERITGFIWAYAIFRPGVNALRTPVYPAMIEIVNNQEVTFEDYRFNRESLRNQIHTYQFTNGRPITKSMLIWWAFQNPNQQLLDNDLKLDIEHIYAKKRAQFAGDLSDKSLLESLGNKAFLEKRINVRASDYQFAAKRVLYRGESGDKKKREATKNQELIELANSPIEFTEKAIKEREDKIIDSFLDYLESNKLLTH
ncbi:hypothetical protein HMPREF1862_00888 [Varibaculum cambriense]|uniref:DUF262 domain-containing protein n=2 Tax=Varibaculum cambriense TaxID=184870 RepID=A0AB34X067_9ACTO|nr:DUF262 domain-containing protein [Varibaculum cambriense]KXB81163.1 hypothetical protein HMPREF1862_00888 [Varibaculum cambriense]